MVARMPRPNKASLELVSAFSGCVVGIGVLLLVAADFTSGSDVGNVGEEVGSTVCIKIGICVGKTVGLGVVGFGV